MPRAPDVSAADKDSVPRVLLVTNDFPPRVGGVQQYEWNVVRHLPADRVMVLAPNWDGWRAHDAEQPFAIRRWPARYLWPTPEVERRVLDLVREHQADVVLFGQGLPIALLGPNVARRGIPYAVLTHGVELWMARVPTARQLLRQALRDARAVTAVSRYTADAVRAAMPQDVTVTLLPPAVDEARFTPDVDGAAVRQRHGLEGASVITCVSRLVRRKGQDVLIRALPVIRDRVGDARLLIVGDGPYRESLETLTGDAPSGSVVFAGEVDDEELPAYYAAADVFAMPCRSRWGGLEVEGFGIVYLEAGATARPSVAGRSGGAAEAVVDQETGLLVEGGEPKAVALAVTQLLSDPTHAQAMGQAGRRRVEESFMWRHRAQELAAVLARAAG